MGRRMAKENQTKELLAMKRSFSLSVSLAATAAELYNGLDREIDSETC